MIEHDFSFTDEDIDLIVRSLRIASEQFASDAARSKHDGDDSLSAQFLRQSAEALSLAEDIGPRDSPILYESTPAG